MKEFFYFNINQTISVTVILFAIIDIIGAIPVIITLRNKAGHIQSGKATLVALVLNNCEARKIVGAIRIICPAKSFWIILLAIAVKLFRSNTGL